MQVSGKRINFLLAATLALTLLFSSAALAFDCSGNLNSCPGIYAGASGQICVKFKRAVMKKNKGQCNEAYQKYKNIGNNTCKNGVGETYSLCVNAVK